MHLLGVLRGLHDQDVLDLWVENPYFQAVCGETKFQHHLRLSVSDLTAWRNATGHDALSAWVSNVLPQPRRTPTSTFVIDVDGVVAMLTPGNDYNLAQPIPHVISAINRLYQIGHRIVMLTARGSGTGLDWEQLTTTQFQSWGLLYHELRFGKPAADYYVDDRMITVEMLCAMADGHPFPPSTRAPRVVDLP